MNSRNTLIIILIIIASNTLFSQIPQNYDSRNYNLVTPVKNQGLECGSCWAFASCAAIESSLLKQGYGTYDLSEDNLIDCHNFDQAPCEWGNYYMAHSLLASHRALLKETDAPYNPNSKTCPINSRTPPSPPIYVEDIRFIQPNETDIKEAIMEYGAVGSAMYFNMDNYNTANYKFYNPSIDDSDYSHCVTIVGWNDTITFDNAPGNGGWIIKDSYGTSWANQGYFYCSYYDAGILSENVVFPKFSELPPAVNSPMVYEHDEFGWVNNYGFSSNEAFALIKYTIIPPNPSMGAQQIKRIGTWAVEENTTIEYELYHTKNGNSLEDKITSGSVKCDHVGYYTIPLSTNTDTLFTDIYIKIKYTCPTGTQKPIPVEEKETNHTSAFSPSSDVCWISSDGKNWSKTGSDTSYNFDLCIKMYTETAPVAKIVDIPSTVCKNDIVHLSYPDFFRVDSLNWLINNMTILTENNISYSLPESGDSNISLKVWLGQNSDSTSKTITVNDIPEKPTITQDGNILESSSASSYQWFFSDMNPIDEQISQKFMPQIEGEYIVKVANNLACFNYSDPFAFYFVGIFSQQISEQIEIFPSPAKSYINIGLPAKMHANNYTIAIYSIDGRCILSKKCTDNELTSFDVNHLKKGIYSVAVINNHKKIGSSTFVKL